MTEKVVEVTEKASDFNQYFLPFHLKSNCKLFKPHSFTLDQDQQATIQNGLDHIVKDSHGLDQDVLEWARSRRRPRGFSPEFTVNQIIELMNGSDAPDEDAIMSILMRVPYKYLQFAGHIRPPYSGTFSRLPNHQLARNPRLKVDPHINYEYDSEIEWTQEDEEGEDIDDEDDSEDAVDEDEDNEMEGFLDADDETDAAVQRRIIGPLTPVIKWNDGSFDPMFDSIKLEILSVDGLESIDPFKDYWTTTSVTQKKDALSTLGSSPDKKKVIPSNQLKPIILKIHGSDMNQILLVEILKKE